MQKGIPPSFLGSGAVLFHNLKEAVLVLAGERLALVADTEVTMVLSDRTGFLSSRDFHKVLQQLACQRIHDLFLSEARDFPGVKLCCALVLLYGNRQLLIIIINCQISIADQALPTHG